MIPPAHNSPAPPWGTPLLLALFLGAAAGPARAADLKLQATLIRGNNDSPATVNHPFADPALSAKLRGARAFKWTNYYQITNLTVLIPLHQSRDVKMSDRCTLKIKYLGASRVAIDCVGQRGQISKGTNTLPFVLGSDDTNNTAWFVSLQSADARIADSAKPISRK
jgi:hypothetical protein